MDRSSTRPATGCGEERVRTASLRLRAPTRCRRAVWRMFATNQPLSLAAATVGWRSSGAAKQRGHAEAAAAVVWWSAAAALGLYERAAHSTALGGTTMRLMALGQLEEQRRGQKEINARRPSRGVVGMRDADATSTRCRHDAVAWSATGRKQSVTQTAAGRARTSKIIIKPPGSAGDLADACVCVRSDAGAINVCGLLRVCEGPRTMLYSVGLSGVRTHEPGRACQRFVQH